MRAEFFIEQPPVRITPWGDKIYIFLAINGEWIEKEEKIWVCDYKEIITTPDKIDQKDVLANPQNYMDWKEITLEKKISSLENASNDIILLMADLIGGEA